MANFTGPIITDALMYLGRDLNRRECQHSDTAILNRALAKYRMDFALVCAFAASTQGVDYGNELLFKELAGQKQLLPCPAVLPNSCEETGAEHKFIAGLIERGARFACFFLATSGTSLDRRITGRLMEAMQKKRLPLALFGAPMPEVAGLAEEFPDLPIMLHAPKTRDRIFWPLFRRTKNLHVSLAANFSPYHGLEILAGYQASDRILFASGFPIAEPGAALAGLLYADLKESDLRKIASGNIERLMAGVKTASARPRAPAPPAHKTPPRGMAACIWRRAPLPLKGAVDMHAHYGKWREFPVWGGFADDLLRAMDRVGMEKIIVAHHACMSPEVVWGNDQVLAAIRKYPGRIAGYATCYPVEKKLGAQENIRCIKGGMTGIKLHNSNWIPYTDPRYRPVWEFADRLRLPVLLHTWGDLPNYEEVFRKYRRAQILLGHSGAGNPEVYVKFARKYPQLYLELVYSVSPYGLVEYFTREVGSCRILYGSDAPWLSMGHQIGRIVFADISEADKKRILVDNPRRILNAIRRP